MTKRLRYKTPDSCPLVMIEWVDSVLYTSKWQHLTDIGDPEPLTCVSVGWLMSETKNAYTLASSMGGIEELSNMQAAEMITIPVEAVKAVHRLKEPRLATI